WSGSDQPSCSATSRPTVLEPSAYQGRRFTLTNPQPKASTASMEGRLAWSEEPSTATAVAPKAAAEVTLPASRSAGITTTHSRPWAAAAAAVAPARFPVEAQATVVRPKARALAPATATTRSLKELVGLRVSSLRKRGPGTSRA